MKIETCRKEYYSTHIDFEKNRMYFAALGHWRGVQDFEDFEQLWIDMSKKMKPNYTLCADLRLMPIFSREIEDLFSKIQKYLINNGLLNMAEVIPLNDISDLQFHRMSEKNKMPTNKFKTMEEAENYLDKLVANLNE